MTAASPVSRPRRSYLDWLRGVAVLLMVEAHLLDSWTLTADRSTAAYRAAMTVGGMGTGLFMFLAGVAVGLSAGSKARRSGDPGSASRAVVRRGLEIFALAFLFRAQAWLLGWSPNPRDLLKVDILNIMGPSIVAAALLWRAGGSTRARMVLYAVAATLSALVAPALRTPPLAGLPDPVEAYFVAVPGLSNFVFFPWIGLLLAGAVLGVLIEDTQAGGRERTLIAWIGACGAALALGGYGASYLPPLHPASSFWTTSASYFFIRAGLMTCGIAAAFWWYATIVRGRWSPLVQLGTTSLFIYWIHVEMVYGLISRPLHRSVPLAWAWVAYVAFVAFLLGCSVIKQRIVARRGPRPAQAPATA